MGFWLQLGVAGFRLDAVPALLETAGLPERVEQDPQEWLRRLRSFAGRRRGDAMLLGEVNVGARDLAAYFGEHGDELHMQSAFLINQHLWLALARQSAEPLETILRELPVVPPDNAWSTFLRNHDELSLDKLTGPQRDEVFAAFAPDEGMRLYGHGIRRRVAPMLGGDPDRLRMAWSLTFSLPGAPMILYGDEIGLGEDLRVDGRMAVRVPMQWSDEANGGFSSAAKKELVRPLAGGDFGAENVNVAAQRREPGSLLNWMERLIRRRRETPEIGWGTATLIETAHGGAVRPARRLAGQHGGDRAQPRRGRGRGGARARRRRAGGRRPARAARARADARRAPEGEAGPLRLPLAARSPRGAAGALLSPTTHRPTPRWVVF